MNEEKTSQFDRFVSEFMSKGSFMGASVSFPAIGDVPAAGPFQFETSLVGYRVATAFQPYPAGLGLLGFHVQLLLAQGALLPNNPSNLVADGTNFGEYQSRESTLIISPLNDVTYTFRRIVFDRIEQSAFCVDSKQGTRTVHVACLTFSCPPARINKTNDNGNGSKLVELTRPASQTPIHSGGSAGFSIDADVVAVSVAKNAPNPSPADFNKGQKKLDLAKISDGSGAVAFEALRNGDNEWINAMLILNAGQSPILNAGQNPNNPVAVPGGKMTLHINGAIFPEPGQLLTTHNVGMYFIEEVWGWCHHSTPLSTSDACALVPVADNPKIDIDSWFCRSLGHWQFDKVDVGAPIVGPATERVCIRFHSGMKKASLFN